MPYEVGLERISDPHEQPSEKDKAKGV